MNVSESCLCRKNTLVADAILEKEYVISGNFCMVNLTPSRKNKQVGQVFAQAFSWPELIDALADVYTGVSDTRLFLNCY